MNSTHKLQLRQHKRRLGLSHNELNKMSRKHNNVNLIKHLQLLNPIAPILANNGFYGSLTITNQTSGVAKSIQVKLAFNDVEMASYITINGGSSQTLNLPIGSRLPNPNSILQLKLIGATGVTQIDAASFNGFTPTNLTAFPYTSENTLSMLVNSNFITNGTMSLTLLVISPPPPPLNTGFYGRIIIYNKKFQSNAVGTNITYTIYAINGGVQTLLKSATTISNLFTNPNPPPDSNKLDIAIDNRLLNSNTQVKVVASLANQNANFLGSSVIGATQHNGPNGWVDDLNFNMTIDSNQITNGTVTIQYLVN
jgi:hypothetical protein